MTFPDEIKHRAIELSTGRSAGEVLRILNREFRNDDLPDERTIRRWCADQSPIHAEQEQEVIHSSAPSNWGEHNKQLGDVANILLTDDLDRVIEDITITNITSAGKPGESRQVEYGITFGTKGDFIELTKEQLTVQLEQNIEFATRQYGEWFFDKCFLPHLLSELPEGMATEGFGTIVEEQSYELIGTLRVLAARKTFKGTCPVCKDW